MTKRCFLCSSTNSKAISNLFGHEVCPDCKSQLGLLKDNTIKKHIASYAKARQSVPEKPTYKEEVDYRISWMDEEYLKKRIKLCHIQERIKALDEK